MGITALRRFTKFVDNILGCGLIRITHAKVDDILAPLAGLILQVRNDVKHIRGQTTDTFKITVHVARAFRVVANAEIEEQ
jgi:hypothetical protein